MKQAKALGSTPGQWQTGGLVTGTLPHAGVRVEMLLSSPKLAVCSDEWEALEGTWQTEGKKPGMNSLGPISQKIDA